MTDAYTSFPEQYRKPGVAIASRKPAGFGWSMITFLVFDLILLFWLMNPISSFSKDRFPVNSPAVETASAFAPDIAKPSPLGPPVTKHTRERVSTRTAAQ